MACGKSERVTELQIPDLECDFCNLGKTITTTVIDKNYYYRCERCKREWKIAAILPHWSEVFPFCGLAAPGDAGF
jgi:hypothetical protein